MSTTSPLKICPQCGGPIPPEAPQGLCPKCLLAQVSLPTEAGQGDSSKAASPGIAELAAAFPQLEILELIGQGGMGFVFKARQPKLDRFVALKILPQSFSADPAFAERFTREGRVLARLNHPNIVTIHDFGQANGFFYLLMEFVDGVNLRQAMKAGRFTPDQALAIVPKICEALQFAHNEGILHRDIKPENILLDAKGRVKIADFGIAKIVGNEGRAELPLGRSEAAQQHRPTGELTEAGKVLGTPNYMAPEQRDCSDEVDQRADIYSLGVVFYEMLTGELPVGRFAPPSEKSTADPRVDEVVLRALEKEKAKRFSSAEEVRTQVETIATSPAASRRRDEPQAGPSSRSAIVKSGLDFKTKATLFGLPLVHVATGLDAETGRKRIARGIFALGDIAQGFVAIGGIAMGGIAFGGVAVGGLAFGGLGLGLIALAGGAFALIGAFGGLAVAPIAIGGKAIGYMAYAGKGGSGSGSHVVDAISQDPIAQDFFLPWAQTLVSHSQTVNAILVLLIVGIGVGVPFWLQIRARKKPPTDPSAGTSRREETQTQPVKPRQDWWTWSPLQSLEAQEICSRLNKAERNHLSILGLLMAVWIPGTIFGISALIRSFPGPGNWIVASVWAVLFIVSIPMLQRMIRHFLCSTAWAREQGFTPEKLRLFSFGRRNLLKAFIVLALGSALILVQNRAIKSYLGLSSLNARDQAQSLPTKRIISNPPFIAQLNEAKVELLVLADQPWTNTAGWLPDGRPSAEPFPIDNGSMSTWAQGKVTKKIAFRIWNESPYAISSAVCRTEKIPDVSPAGSSFRPSWRLNPAVEFIELISCPSNAQEMNISLGVANAPWETAIALIKAGWSGTSSFGSPTEGDWSAAFHAVAGDSDVAINCTYTKNEDWESRMVYMSGDGKIIPIPENSSPINNQTGGIVLVSSNEFTGIKEFRLQRRKYQWAEFRNVSLQVGHRTTVAVTEKLERPIGTIQPAADPTNAMPVFDTETEQVITSGFSFSANRPSTVTWRDGKGIGYSISTLDKKEKFLSQHGIDLFTDHSRSLYGVDVRIAPATWNSQVTFEQLAGRLESSNRFTLYGMLSVPTKPPTPAYWFETRDGIKGLLQITGFTDNPRGVKIRYKLVQPTKAPTPKSDSAPTPPMIYRWDSDVEGKTSTSDEIAETPKLRFLAWQDEWETRKSGAVRHPDGSPVTNAEELKWLKIVDAGGMNTTYESHPRFLKLWFSHLAFKRTDYTGITLLDDDGHPLKRGANGESSCSLVEASELNGGQGWRCWNGSPVEGTLFPAHLTVQLSYAVGPLEKTQEVRPDFNGTMSLEGNSILNGMGENAQGRAFLSIAVNAKAVKSRLFGVMAVMKDGRKLQPIGGGRPGYEGSMGAHKFEFPVPISAVAKFIIGTRPIRTNEWRNVVLPKPSSQR